MKKMKKKIFNFANFIHILKKVTSLDSLILPQAEYITFPQQKPKFVEI